MQLPSSTFRDLTPKHVGCATDRISTPHQLLDIRDPCRPAGLENDQANYIRQVSSQRIDPYLGAYPSFTSRVESVTALPGIGIQLETRKGYLLPAWSSVYPPAGFTRASHRILGLSSTTSFIPLSSVRPTSGTGADSVFLHEALYRWSVRFYLGVLYCAGRSQVGIARSDGQQGSLSDTWQVQVLFPVSTVSRAERRRAS